MDTYLQIQTDGGFLPRKNLGAWAFICGHITRYGTFPCRNSTYAELFAYMKAVEYVVAVNATHAVIISDCEGAISVMQRVVWTDNDQLNALIVRIRKMSQGRVVGYRHVKREEIRTADRACNRAFRMHFEDAAVRRLVTK